MQSLFEKNLLRMKSELTDLKTVHRRGLGVIRFYEKSVTFTVPSASGTRVVAITATVADDEPEWPVYSFFVKGAVGANGIRNVYFVSQSAKTIRFAVQSTPGIEVTATVVSSSIIKEMVWQ